jgi:hypothetical protein
VTLMNGPGGVPPTIVVPSAAPAADAAPAAK